ncbi:hypothetical protein K443DRAFT_256088 [Laccaria amethystina LaAM-08-1]|uniref:Uncharacterized protein n=1 Tax=Laccaria amethystina LaAM-08-1 TaxID=1095629 RepID=A0A0C9XMF0_9AGAR|nr:hypothetical protein K443DRAFT_256088 [Laccaria amethystina LaAM-08-1]
MRCANLSNAIRHFITWVFNGVHSCVVQLGQCSLNSLYPMLARISLCFSVLDIRGLSEKYGWRDQFDDNSMICHSGSSAVVLSRHRTWGNTLQDSLFPG